MNVAALLDRILNGPKPTGWVMPGLKSPPEFYWLHRAPFFTYSSVQMFVRHDLTIDDAFEAFTTYGLPVVEDEVACVADAHGVMVIGWEWTGTECRWTGSQFGLDMVRKNTLGLFEPGLIADIETQLEKP